MIFFKDYSQPFQPTYKNQFGSKVESFLLFTNLMEEIAEEVR